MKKSLLIAEDDENILALLLNVFSRPDLELHPARSGAEAMDLIDRVITSYSIHYTKLYEDPGGKRRSEEA